jgi:ankyrin repeat protein
VLRSDLTLVNALIAHHANPNIRMTKGTWKRRDGEDFTLPATLIGSTPYLLAAKFLEPEILAALKAGGADAGLTMPNGATPLMLAAGMNSTNNASRRGVRVVDFGKVEPESQALETVKAVLDRGGDVNATTVAGDTALHGAAAMGYNTVIQLLVDRGAPLNAKNKRGLTPLRRPAPVAVEGVEPRPPMPGDNPAVGPSSGTIAFCGNSAQPSKTRAPLSCYCGFVKSISSCTGLLVASTLI